MKQAKTVPIVFSISAAIFVAALICLADDLSIQLPDSRDSPTQHSAVEKVTSSPPNIVETKQPIATPNSVSTSASVETLPIPLTPGFLLSLSLQKTKVAIETAKTQITNEQSSELDSLSTELPTLPPSKQESVVHIVEKPKITDALLKLGTWGRPYSREMKPQYITIHSTQNWSAIANAEGHAKLLKSGGKRSTSWHFTVDESSIFQSLPTSEQGRHSDFGGKGDKTSIGIEMCENWGNSKEKTLDRTCHLVAWLMNAYDIPITNVVPHFHWRAYHPRRGYLMDGKPCPHFFIDSKKTGLNAKWDTFIDKIELLHLGKTEFIAKRTSEKQAAENVASTQPSLAPLLPPSDGSCTLRGIIFEDQGVGIKDTSVRLAGARVRVVQTGRETSTNDQGSWVFKVAPGHYTIEVTHEGHKPKNRECEVNQSVTTWASMGMTPVSDETSEKPTTLQQTDTRSQNSEPASAPPAPDALNASPAGAE